MNFSFLKRTKDEERRVDIRCTNKQKVYQKHDKTIFYRRLDNLCTKIYEF